MTTLLFLIATLPQKGPPPLRNYQEENATLRKQLAELAAENAALRRQLAQTARPAPGQPRPDSPRPDSPRQESTRPENAGGVELTTHADAEVWVNDKRLPGSGTSRTWTSPVLKQDQLYRCIVTVEVTIDGRPRSETRAVYLIPNYTARLTIMPR